MHKCVHMYVQGFRRAGNWVWGKTQRQCEDGAERGRDRGRGLGMLAATENRGSVRLSGVSGRRGLEKKARTGVASQERSAPPSVAAMCTTMHTRMNVLGGSVPERLTDSDTEASAFRTCGAEDQIRARPPCGTATPHPRDEGSGPSLYLPHFAQRVVGNPVKPLLKERGGRRWQVTSKSSTDFKQVQIYKDYEI